MTASFKKICSVTLLCLSAVFVAACGVKGDPKPDYSHDNFGLASLTSSVEFGGVLSVSGKLTGSYQNVDHLILQLQPVDGELCAGCPFLPQEQFLIESEDIWRDGDGTTFDAVVRPVFTAETYRWRIVGQNTYAGIPLVVSDVQSAGAEGSSIEQNVPVPPVQ